MSLYMKLKTMLHKRFRSKTKPLFPRSAYYINDGDNFDKIKLCITQTGSNYNNRRVCWPKRGLQ